MNELTVSAIYRAVRFKSAVTSLKERRKCHQYVEFYHRYDLLEAAADSDVDHIFQAMNVSILYVLAVFAELAEVMLCDITDSHPFLIWYSTTTQLLTANRVQHVTSYP